MITTKTLANSFSKLHNYNFQFKMTLQISFFYNGRFWNWLIIIWPADKEAISQSRKAAHMPMKQAESALVQSDCAWSKSASNVMVYKLYIKHKHHFRLKYQRIYCHKLISNVNVCLEINLHCNSYPWKIYPKSF